MRSRATSRPIFDLYPSDGNIDKLRAATRSVKSALDRISLDSFVQTTGSRGIHIVVLLDRSAAFDAARAFARALMRDTVEANPDALTIEQRKDRRGTRVFLDYLRNAYGQTAAAPYAVRAIEGAPVATPLKWHEIDDPRAALPRRSHALRDAERRLAKPG